MLSGAVVVERGRLLAACDEGFRGRLMHGRVGAAREVGDAEAPALQEPRGYTHVPRLSPVGGAHEGDVVVAEAEGALAAGGEKRHRLERLRCGAEVELGVRIAGGRNRPSLLVDDGHEAPVDRLDAAAAQDVGDGWRAGPCR